MVKPLLNNLRHWFRRVTPAPTAEETDRQLLERFARQRDESAFGVLLTRHGPMVLGVCRRLLAREQDAEDAFQATFLVLARRADSVRWQDDIANWLYTVACRVARKLRSGLSRRRENTPPAELAGTEPAPSADLDRQELRSILDEEVGRLPEKYRVPVVLCYLEGKSYGEAARLLGWAEGTVSGRLARARDVLRGRLARRGLAPTGAALFAVLAPEAVSASLKDATLAVLSFATGHAAVVPRSAELAEGVLRTMTLTKIKTTFVLLLAVCLVGTGVGVLAHHTRPGNDPKAPKDSEPARRVERPPLPETWKGRWQADPFAGTTSIEVWHNGRGLAKSYHLKDAKVVAKLLAELKITSIQNDMARGNIPPARLTFHKKGGEDVQVWLADDGTVQFYNAEVHVRRAFLDALNKHLSQIETRPINLLQFLPGSELPPPNQPRPRVVPPSLRALQGDWKALEVLFTVGGRLHEAKIADAGMLKRLRPSFQVVAHQADQGRKGLPFPQVAITCADGSTARGHVLSDTQLFVWDVGLLTLKPAFAEALGKELGRLEGRPLTLRGENPLTEKQLARERDLRRLLAGARTLHFRDGERRLNVTVDKPEDVTGILKGLTWVEAPLRPLVRARTERVVEVKVKGKQVRLTWLNTDVRAGGGFLPILAWRDGALWMKADGARPLGGDLIEVSGFGQVWLDGQWKYRFQHHSEALQLKARQERAEETTRRVTADLPAFLRQVKNVEIVSGAEQTRELLSEEASRPVLEALKIDRVEKLDWTAAQWRQTLDKLEKADELILTPGLGFSLALVVSGDREMLIPGYGRVTLKSSPREAIRKAAQGGGKDGSLMIQP